MGELDPRIRLSVLATVTAGVALTACFLAPVARGADALEVCAEAYPEAGLFTNIKGALKDKDCACSRLFFTEFGRENLVRLQENLDFFDKINRQIFFCEIEAEPGDLAGEAKSRIKGFAK